MRENGMKKVLIIIFLVLLFAVIALFVLNYSGVKSFEISTENHEELTEEEMLEIFQKDYGWTCLKNQQLFWDEDEKQVVINYYFVKDAESWQIDSAMEYGLNTFVFKQYLQLSPQLYQIWSYGKEISEVVIQAYEEGKMVRQDVYGGIINGIVHEESHFGK